MDDGHEWSDKSPFEFYNWAYGEPNNALGQESCVSLYAGDGSEQLDTCNHVTNVTLVSQGIGMMNSAVTAMVSYARSQERENGPRRRQLTTPQVRPAEDRIVVYIHATFY